MTDHKNKILKLKNEVHQHLTEELLPFWFDRCKDDENGGFITHFDQEGNDTGVDEKSMLGQARCVYSFASAHRAGYGDGKCLEYAKHGVDFIIEKMWDKQHEGFFWLTDRKGNVLIDEKIIYGHSFIIYGFCEYTLASGDPRGLHYAEKCFDLLQKHGADTMYGGYFEMFQRDWTVKGPRAAGGDRKTLDVHMHLMEAFTTLYEVSGKAIHKRKLLEIIDILTKRIIHPKYLTGIPQFTVDWKVAPQIKFDIIWGWDRFSEDGVKSSPDDNTSYGHNVEFAWLLMHAMEIADIPFEKHKEVIQTQFKHALDDGIDWEFGGVYVEGSHAGGVTDHEKEFWQHAEMLIALLQACIVFGQTKYLPVYENVHRFVFDKMIEHNVGEWIPLLTRKGEPIWKHMSHNWKINYHTIRAMIQSIERMNKLLA